MKTVEQRSPYRSKYSPRRQSVWVLADYGGKDLWNRWVLSLGWKS